MGELSEPFGIGIDIGGSSTKAAIVDPAGAVRSLRSVPTVPGPEGVVATAVRVAGIVAAEAGVTTAAATAIGIGIPGVVDPRLGTVRFAVNVGIDGDTLDLAARLTSAMGATVHVENDVRAAALGVDRYLASIGEPVSELAYLSVGTGIAAGYVEHGRIRRGSRLAAGEIGHIPIDPSGPRCACGQIGCIEAIASGGAIERAWPSASGSSALDLYRAAEVDESAKALWSRVVGGLSTAVLMLALNMDPELIVVGGGVAAVGQPLVDAIAARIASDGRRSAFVDSLDLGGRLRVVDPTVPVGPIGAIRAAQLEEVALWKS